MKRNIALALCWMLQRVAGGYWHHYPLRDHFHVSLPPTWQQTDRHEAMKLARQEGC